MSGELPAAEKRVKSIKTRLAEVRLTLEKSTSESYGTKTELWAEMSVAEESFQEENTHVELQKRKVANEIGQRQQLVSERREMSKTASRQLGDSFQALRSKAVVVTAEWDEWYNLANEVSNNLKTSVLTWLYSRRYGRLL